MSADKRTVFTDALETLGKVIDDTQKRDAIHLAVIPVQATVTVYPGQHVNAKGTPSMHEGELLGIVDPFLAGPVYPGQHYWLVIYPRKITSLRHVWSHPAFDEEDAAEVATTPTYDAHGNFDPPPIKPATYQRIDSREERARKWIEEFAEGLELDYDTLIEGANDYLDGGDYIRGGANLEGEYVPNTFWEMFEIVTGRTVPDSDRNSFFSCSC
jgi:hypothetical protein